MTDFNPLSGSQTASAEGGTVIEGGLIRIGVVYDRLRQDARNAVGEFNRELQQAGAGLAAGMQQANQQLEIANKRASGLTLALQAAAISGASALVAVLSAATAAAIGYEAAFANVRKTVRGSEAELKALSDQFLVMSTRTVTSAQGLAAIAAQAGALGIATRDVAAFTKTIDTLTLATDVGAQQAVQALGMLADQLDLTGSEYGRLSSTVVALSNQMTATGSQILSTAERSATAAKMIGLTPQQLLGWSAALGSVAGVGGQEAAGTLLQRMFSGFQQFVAGGKEAESIAKRLGVSFDTLLRNGRAGTEVFDRWAASLGMSSSELMHLAEQGDSMERMAKVAGMTTEAFQAMFAAAPSDAMQKFLTGLGQLDDYAQRDILKKLNFDDAYMAEGILSLATNMETLNKALAVGPEAWRENTAATEAAAKQLDTVSGRIQMLRNVLTAQLEQIGEAFLPPLKEALTWIAEQMPAAFEAAADTWHRILEPALMPLLKSLQSIGQALAGVATEWDSWTGIVGSSTKAMSPLRAAFDGIASAVALMARYLTVVTDAINALLRLPGVTMLLQFGLAMGGMALQLKFMQAIIGMARGSGNAILAGVTGGRMGVSNVLTPEARALMGAAEALTGAAGALSGAASSQVAAAGLAPVMSKGAALTQPLSAAAMDLRSAFGIPFVDMAGRPVAGGLNYAPLTMRGYRPRDMSYYTLGSQAERQARALGGNLSDPAFRGMGVYNMGSRQFQPGGFGQIGREYPLIPIEGAPGSYALPNGRPVAYGNNPLGYAAAMRASREAELAGRSLVGQMGGRVADGLRSGLQTARGGLSALGSGVSATLSLVSKAFWPLFIADMVGNLLAQPLGSMIANATGNARFNKSGEQGWLPLIGDTLAAMLGRPAGYIGRPGEYQIGTARVKTQTLMEAGIPSELLDRLEQGGLAGLLAQREIQQWQTQFASQPWTGKGGGRATIEELAQFYGGATAMGMPENFDAFMKEALAGAEDPQAALDRLHAAFRDQVADSAAATQNTITEAINDAARQLAIEVAPYALQRLGPEATESLAKVYDWAGRRGGAGAAMFARFATQQATGSFTAFEKGGAEALTHNTEQIAENTKAYNEWVEAHRPEVAAGGSFVGQYGAQIESLAGASDEAKRDFLQRSGLLTPEEVATLTDPAALAQMWGTVWDAYLAAQEAGGFDQRREMADNVKTAVTEALAGGMDIEQIRAQLGPLWDLLFDGIGADLTDKAQRLAQAFFESLGDSLRNANTDAAKQAILDKFEGQFGALPGATTGEKWGQFVSTYIQSRMPEIMQATPEQRAGIQQDITSRFGAAAPATWEDLVRTGLPALGSQWATGNRADLTAQINTLLGDRGAGAVPWTEADINAMVNASAPGMAQIATEAGKSAVLAAAGNDISNTVADGIRSPESVERLRLAWLDALGQATTGAPVAQPEWMSNGQGLAPPAPSGPPISSYANPDAAERGLPFAPGAAIPQMPGQAPAYAATTPGAAVVNRSQTINVDNMYLLGAGDRESTARQLAFMAGAN
jgi:TP901 family phage tail tape measure protein